MFNREYSGTYKYSLRILFDVSVNEQNFAGPINSIGTLNHLLKKNNVVKIIVNQINDYSLGVVPDPSINIISIPTDKYVEGIYEKYKDFDLVVTENQEVREKLESENDKFVTDIKGCLRFVEIFLRGHDIPWSFSSEIKDMPWLGFYNMCEDFGVKASEKFGLLDTLTENSEGKNIARSLFLNKVGDLLFTRDKIMFYIQQQAYTQKVGLKNQSFSFERAYYLSVYYLLLSGMVDQLARVINILLDLGIENKFKKSLSDDKFRETLGLKLPELLEIFDDKFLDWDSFLRAKRNFVAHEGSVTLSPLVKEPEQPLTDEELEKAVDSKVDWEIASFMFTPEQIKAYRDLVKHLVYVDTLEVIAEDTMYIKYKKRGSKVEEEGVFLPLLSVENDYIYFQEILLKAADILISYFGSAVK